MNERPKALEVVAGAIGGVIGGVIGFMLYGWIIRQGFYAPMLPGALIGLGSGLTARTPCTARGVICAVAALALGFYTEWRFFPWISDPSLSYFVQNLHNLKSITLVLVAIGAAIAFYLGKDGGFRRRPPL